MNDEDNLGTKAEKVTGDDVEEEDDGRHTRMLQGITGMPSEAFEGTIVGFSFSVKQGNGNSFSVKQVY